MKQSPRHLRASVALVMIGAVLWSCGGTATTAPPAAPAAPAASAAPAVSAAPAAPAAVKALFVVADTTSGSLGTTDEEKAALGCVQKNRFPQGESIVWRVKVMSPVTGKAMDDKQLKGVVLTLADGTTKDFKFGPHPKGQTDDYFWATSFKIPDAYPTGAFKYKVTATSIDGITGEYSQFNVASAMLQVVKVGTR